MAMRHYSGELGTFDYDDKDFELISDKTMDMPFDMPFPYLHYKGKEKNGEKIKIPDGITNCRYMFRDCDLKKPPYIPESTKSCEGMFFNCKNLRQMASMGRLRQLEDCSFMYSGCSSLSEKAWPTDYIPDQVMNCSYMFDRCSSLKAAPGLHSQSYNEQMGITSNAPRCFRNYDGMFSGCTSLEKMPFIPDGAQRCCGMFADCASLKETTAIPDTVQACDNMFYGCKSLSKAPLFNSYESGIADRYQHHPSVKSCSGMFAYCENMKTPGNVPKHAIVCTEMYKGCSSLESVPIIPESVVESANMFQDCSDAIQSAGAWCIRNRGYDHQAYKTQYESKYGSYKGDHMHGSTKLSDKYSLSSFDAASVEAVAAERPKAAPEKKRRSLFRRKEKPAAVAQRGNEFADNNASPYDLPDPSQYDF